MAELIDVVANKKKTSHNKKTNEQFLCDLKAAHGDTFTPLEEYKGSSQKIKIHCNICNNDWATNPSNLVRGSGCPNCMKLSYRLSHDEYVERLKNEMPTIELLSTYINGSTKVHVKCNVCSYEWDAKPYDLVSQHKGCPICGRKRIGDFHRMPIDDFYKILDDNNIDITILSDYNASGRELHVKCNVCGYEWDVLRQSLVKGHGCKKCYNNRQRKTDECFKKELQDVNPNLELLTKYNGSSYEVTALCKVCNHKWTAPAANLLRHKCPNCYQESRKTSYNDFISMLPTNIEYIGEETDYDKISDNYYFKCLKCNNVWKAKGYVIAHNDAGCPACNFSKGESKIEEYLIYNKLKFESQKKYENLIGIGGRFLSYDFYLPDYNLLIEFQGEQHERPVEHFGGEATFEKQQEHDKRKREYAKAHDINLLEIWYYDIDNIDEILTNEINNLKFYTQETVIPA